LTFDGSSKALASVDQSKSNGTDNYFDTGNEYADDVFEDATIGIRGGHYGYGFAETSVLRCKFMRHSDAGIHIENFNALDLFVWYSDFEDNYYGITNYPGAGNFHAFNSVFQRSKNADLKILNTGNFNFRNNFSTGSNMFLNESYYYTNGAVTRLQNNTVVIPANNSCNDCAIYQGNMGPLFLSGNLIASPAKATGPAVLQHSLDPPDCISIGNIYTVDHPVSCSGLMERPGRFITLDDRIVTLSSLDLTPPALPGVLPSKERQIFEVSSGSGSEAIQLAINRASALCGNRPIVHLSYGAYSVDQTLTIPANCDIQMVGDGANTSLRWTGSGTGPVMILEGPSRAILRDFHLNAGSVEGIMVQNADQPGSRVYMQQMNFSRALSANLLVDGLDHTNVEAHNFYSGSTAISPAATGIAVKVVGGPLAFLGQPRDGKTSLYAGAMGDNYLSYDISKGARFVVRDVWYEGRNNSLYAHVTDNSIFTVEGSRIALPSGNGNAIKLQAFTGNASIVQSSLDNGIDISSDTSGNVWALGNYFNGTSYYSDTTAHFGFTDNRWRDPSYGSRAISDAGRALSASFARTMLSHSMSENPTSITSLPAGITDLRFYRVFIERGSVGLHLMP
jgi:hypothetical protein